MSAGARRGASAAWTPPFEGPARLAARHGDPAVRPLTAARTPAQASTVYLLAIGGTLFVCFFKEIPQQAQVPVPSSLPLCARAQ